MIKPLFYLYFALLGVKYDVIIFHTTANFIHKFLVYSISADLIR